MHIYAHVDFMCIYIYIHTDFQLGRNLRPWSMPFLRQTSWTGFRALCFRFCPSSIPLGSRRFLGRV